MNLYSFFLVCVMKVLRFLKSLFLILVGSIIALCVLTFCTLYASSKLDKYRNSKFEQDLVQKINSGASESNFKEITDFDWDEYFIHIGCDYEMFRCFDKNIPWTVSFYNKSHLQKKQTISNHAVELIQPTNNISTTFRYQKGTKHPILNGQMSLLIK